MTSKNLLRGVLGSIGIVMVVAGLSSVVLGAASVPDDGGITPNVDSEMRFYAVWYVAFGTLLLHSLRAVEEATLVVRVAGVAFFAAGCARIVSWLHVGRPHDLAVVLMVIELVLPFVMIPWQSTIRRR